MDPEVTGWVCAWTVRDLIASGADGSASKCEGRANADCIDDSESDFASWLFSTLCSAAIGTDSGGTAAAIVDISFVVVRRGSAQAARQKTSFTTFLLAAMV